MKLVIDIPQEVKEAFDKASKDNINFCFYDYNSVIGKAIKNGTPLDDIRKEIEQLNPVDYGSMFSYESHNGAKDMKRDALDIIDKHIGKRGKDEN